MLTHEEIVKNIIPKLKDAYLDDKRGLKLRVILVKLFENAENPYTIGLDLTEKAGDYFQPRSNSLSGSIFKEFHCWFIARYDKEDVSLLTDEIRRRAFDVCSKRHTHLLAISAEIYKLRECNENLVKEFVVAIRRKAKEGFYKEAINCVTILKLQLHFGLNEIAIPCILQDKTNFIEPYFDGFPDLQVKIVKILDELCSPFANVDQFLKFYQIQDIRKDKLSLKPIQRLVARIAKQYNIPPDVTPNLTKTRSQGTLRYLLHRRYTENAMEAANFDDMVYQAVEMCPHLADYLLGLLCDVHNEFPEAAKWAARFRVPRCVWPKRLYDFVQANPNIVAIMESLGSENETCENSDEYVTLPFESKDVVIVDDETKLNFTLQCIENANIIGLDTEWQPSFGQHIEKVAFLQISTKERAFLLDVLNLLKNLNEAKLTDFMRRLFCNEKLLKLGFQFGGDLKTLGVTLPFCREIFLELRNTCCVGTLIDVLKHQDINFMNDISVDKNDDLNVMPEKDIQDGACKDCKATNRSLPNSLSAADLMEFPQENSFCEEQKRESDDEKSITAKNTIVIDDKMEIDVFDFDEPLDKDDRSFETVEPRDDSVSRMQIKPQESVPGSENGCPTADLKEIIDVNDPLDCKDLYLDPKTEENRSTNQNVSSVSRDNENGEVVASDNLTADKQPSVKPHCGLSEVCLYFLGKPLNKNEQFSNWARRPLRISQIRYAALDAFCLIEIFEKVKQRAADLKLDFEKAFLRSLISGSKVDAKPKSKKSTATRQLEKAELMQMIEKLNQAIKIKNSTDVKSPKDVKVVVDNMLQGLGKHLRRCGIDSLIMENYQSREATIDVARSECRIALSSGQAFSAISQRLPKEMSCCVPNMINSKEQLAWFLEKFNIVVTESDIFSRCMVCNSVEFLLVPTPLFRIVWDAVVAPYDYINPIPFDAQDAEKRAKTFLTESESSLKSNADGGGKTNSRPIRFDADRLMFYIDYCAIEILTAKMYTLPQSSKTPLSPNINTAMYPNIEIQVDTVPAAKAFESIDLFYVCRTCGKVYWDGSHMKRYVDEVGVVAKS